MNVLHDILGLLWQHLGGVAGVTSLIIHILGAFKPKTAAYKAGQVLEQAADQYKVNQ